MDLLKLVLEFINVVFQLSQVEERRSHLERDNKSLQRRLLCAEQDIISLKEEVIETGSSASQLPFSQFETLQLFMRRL
jgi:hypothetical protein